MLPTAPPRPGILAIRPEVCVTSIITPWGVAGVAQSAPRHYVDVTCFILDLHNGHAWLIHQVGQKMPSNLNLATPEHHHPWIREGRVGCTAWADAPVAFIRDLSSSCASGSECSVDPLGSVLLEGALMGKVIPILGDTTLNGRDLTLTVIAPPLCSLSTGTSCLSSLLLVF